MVQEDNTRPAPQPSKDQALQATQAFFDSAAQDMHTPLANWTMHQSPVQQWAMASEQSKNWNPRRSSCLAQGNLDTVRPSKRGDVLVMKKMGLIKDNKLVSDEAKQAYA